MRFVSLYLCNDIYVTESSCGGVSAAGHKQGGAMEDKQQERREERHRRRVKNQTAAYIALIVLITLAAIAVVAGVKAYTEGQETEQTQQESNQAVLNEMLASEEELQVPESLPPTEPETSPEPSYEERQEEVIREQISLMTLEDKVAGLFLVTPESITGVSAAIRAGDGTRDALSKYAVGGLVYAAKNIKSEEQFREMLANTSGYTKNGIPLFLAVEEEGGSTSTVANAGIGEKSASPSEIGQTGDPENARQAGTAIGAALNGLGISLNLAPVADIATVEKSWLGSRSYGNDATLVGSMAVSMLQGMESQGITACVKYFPGTGSTAEDPGKGISVTDRTAEQFEQEEFVVFRQLIEAGAKMIMVSDVAAPALTGNNEPGIFSGRLVTEILREELGFEGVIVSGALNMAAVSEYYGADEAAIMALKAGCDMLYLPEDFEKAYQAVLRAVQDGTVSEERINDALYRIYRIKYADSGIY